MSYECKRCFYTTKLKTDMKRHINKKVKCPRIFESYKYNEKDLEELSLMYSDKTLIVDNFNNINTIEELIIYIKKNKINKCFYCNTEYKRHYELLRHIKNTCKMIDFNKIITKNDIKENIQTNILQNNITNITNQQITNNITINVYNNDNNILLVPFDKNYDLSKIDDKKKLILFLEDKKYSKTMEEILQNDKNLNVIFDKDTDLGLIYKNDVEKFINMKTNDIIDKTMLKIYNHLLDFYNDIKDKGYVLSELDTQKDIVEKKFEEYSNNKNNMTKECVKNILVDIFDKNKDKVIERFIKFATNSEVINIEDNIKDILIESNLNENNLINNCNF